MVQRWLQLPLDHALSYAGQVRALVQSVADRVAAASGTLAAPVVPDLGPATLMDQLTVLVYEASATASSTGTPTLTSSLAQDLAALRRELS